MVDPVFLDALTRAACNSPWLQPREEEHPNARTLNGCHGTVGAMVSLAKQLDPPVPHICAVATINESAITDGAEAFRTSLTLFR